MEAIIKRRAEKGRPAEYWNLEEQETRLIAAYNKWLKEGTVWSAAAPKVCLRLNSTYNKSRNVELSLGP